MELEQHQKIELNASIYKVIGQLRGQGIYDPLVIADILNQKYNLGLSVTEVAEKITAYKETLVTNLLDNYKDNVIQAVEKYIYIYQKAMQDESYKVALAALDSIIKLQQLDKIDIYEKFGVSSNEVQIDASDRIRQEKVIQLMKNKVSILQSKQTEGANDERDYRSE